MNKLQRRLRKTGYYSLSMAKLLVPGIYYQRQLHRQLKRIDINNDRGLRDRLDYYCQIDKPFELPTTAKALRDITLGKKNTYYLDFHQVSRHLDPAHRVNYLFGDVVHVPHEPTLVKSRPLNDDNANGILMKWNTIRHYYLVNDDRPYRDKQDQLIWRGRAGRSKARQAFIQRWYNHALTDIGDCSPACKEQPWYTPFTSIADQLRYKFILSIEGVDVATNLKWIMSSNSLCFMRKPRYETWFMEGRLIPGHHYVCLRDDFSDLEEKVDYYLTHPDEAESIVSNAQAWVDQFRQPQQELSLQLHLLMRYLELTDQLKMNAGNPANYAW